MIDISKRYVKAPSWNVAGLFLNDEDFLNFFKFLQKNNIKNPITCVYGSIFSKFEGGRTGLSSIPLNKSIELINEYNNLNINCRLTLSNHLINGYELKNDKNVNQLLSFMSNNNNNYTNIKNGVTITLDSTADYIKTHYPNLETICSVIRPAVEVGWGKETVEYYNNLLSKYDYVVINSGKVKDTNFIKQLQHKEKIEVIINSRCELNCPFSKEHYDNCAMNVLINDSFALYLLSIKEMALWKKCPKNNTYNSVLSGSNFSEEEINNLLEMNISHFKMEGREWPIHILMRDFGDYIFNNVQLNRIYRKMGRAY